MLMQDVDYCPGHLLFSCERIELFIQVMTLRSLKLDMKAVVFNKNGLQLADDYPRPVLKEGEALVRVAVAGICGTDLEVLGGYKGFEGVMGHEFCGVIEDIKKEGSTVFIDGDNTRLEVGARVVGEINCGCGSCSYCLSGLKSHCLRRTATGITGRDGCMAEYVALPLENLHPVPDAVSDVEAVFTEPLAAAFEITEQVHIRASDRVMVLGDGRLGILSALVLNLTQADVFLVGKYQEKLDIAAGQKVKTILLEDLLRQKEVNETSWDLVVEATGSLDGFELARRLVKPRGKVVLKSTVLGKTELSLTPLVLDEITVVGSRCGPFAPALRALDKKVIEVKSLISGIYDFEQAFDAFELCRKGASLKVLLDFRQA